MGFLTKGDTLTWEESKSVIEYVRQHGVQQFLNLYRKHAQRDGVEMLWGDEVEYIMIKFDDDQKKVEANLRATSILDLLTQVEEQTPPELRLSSWKPEYGRYMIEGTPGIPYDSLLLVEENMRQRRRIVEAYLNPDEAIITLTHFPMLGVACPDVMGPIANSLFVSDDFIHPHHRFGTLTKNIRERKGHNIAINVPLFMDKNTQPLTYDHLFPHIQDPSKIPALKNHVYADAMVFGMGQCCLQTTFSLPNIGEALQLYDQMVALTPIMLAITAATPILRGYLTDTDVRWNIISAAVDDRTDEELGLEPLQNNKFVIDKSRYASISSYLSQNSRFKPEYNDVPLIIDESIYQQLRDEGIDHLLAQHIAHLFIRDPLVIYNNKIELDDKVDTDHFENIQSTNWQTLRFKPPPSRSNIGWRVEFRPMECSITDFENAAFASFIYLLTRVIREFNLNLYLPLSKVDENMEFAQKRDSVMNQKFWFRNNISPDSSDEYSLMTIDTIINGSNQFVGIIPLVKKYLEQHGTPLQNEKGCDLTEKLQKYLQLISYRASGKLLTTASWIRSFVISHPSYKEDSVVPCNIIYDLCKTIIKIDRGQTKVPSLLGNLYEPDDVPVMKAKM